MNDSKRTENAGVAFEHYRVLLFSIAYRMTGSASDAEDLVQETYLRYQARADQEIVALKAYLSTIVTRLALNYLKSARVAREHYIGTWLPEPILTSEDHGFPLANLEQQEALSLAFLRLLETLSPPERAVFLLHEVFEYPFRDVSSMLDKSPANCRQIYHRAKQALQDKRVRFEPEPERQRQLVLSFLSASQAGNMTQLISLLTQDVVSWSDGGGNVPSALKPIHGPQAVARFWTHWLSQTGNNQQRLSVMLAEINGSPAILCWEAGRLVVVISLAVSVEGIREIDALLNPEKLAFVQQQLSSSRSSNSVKT